ncbi:ABC transporter ATP-binding protein [Nocardia sp. CA-290969]|uniref:ABC transporter ATP-binding protein n=1 Tax=Nocardia sp. CA-290969 TaxID=3239986 RepID=UPI003D8AA993
MNEQEGPLLEVRDIGVRFGGVHALSAVSFSVRAGEVCALIGPNGAGKTTLFNVISGVYQSDSGAVRLDGRPLNDLRPDQRASLGIARTFQNVALFNGMTVMDNVLVGAYRAHPEDGFLRGALQPRSTRRRERESRSECLEILQLLEIEEFADRDVDGLPFGTLKRIELARALAVRPRLMLLDEPAAGLTHSEVDELVELLKRLKTSHHLTLLVVEHHMRLVMNLSDRVVALNFGETMANGTPREVAADPRVIAAYLGVAG